MVRFLEVRGLGALFEGLSRRGYRIVGPTVRDGSIVYDELDSPDALPVGWTDEQDAGIYRLEHREDDARFGFAVGPHSWKQFLFPARLRLWSAKRRSADGLLEIEAPTDPPPRYAFVGMRSCELHAIAIQDRVFAGGEYVDDPYREARDRAFVVAVNCGQAGGTCFCVSMDTGPRCSSGFDVVLTEVIQASEHGFVVDSGSERGAEVLAELNLREASQGEIAAAAAATEKASSEMGRRLDTNGIQELLQANPNHRRWEEVAGRCLTCANCTMVCPTCFCSSVEDVTDLGGENAERIRSWDSCFTVDYSYIHGGSVRQTTSARYRHWLTHKLSSWHDQFGTSGCVGCGRCITWCPVGIDITEEVRALRTAPSGKE